MNIKPLLDVIGQLESHGNYNAKFSKISAIDDLSQYTISDILKMQYRWGRSTGSSAFGRYQFIRKTLRSLVEEEDLDPDTTFFTPEMQDRLATVLLERRGLERWKAGKLSDSRFLDNLSKEWASLPYHTGRSYYAGDGMNRSHVSRQEMERVLESVRHTPTIPITKFDPSDENLYDEGIAVDPPSEIERCRMWTLRQGGKGGCVEKVQRAINKVFRDVLKVDGDFGPKTVAEVRRFQFYGGLIADGVVGPETWGASERYL